MKRIILTAATLLALLSPSASTVAQERIVIAPLFEYPTAPEEMASLEDRSNFLMENFWSPLDVKATTISQHALDDAFSVYVSAMQFADRDVVFKSIENLLKRLKKNPALLTQMTKAAEDNLYGSRADILSDEVYIPFLKAAVSNKKIPALRKARWKSQLAQLERSAAGSTLPSFKIEERKGGNGFFIPRHKMTIIEFGDPSCEDCRFSRLTLETNVPLRTLVDSEKVGIAFIVVSPEEGWKDEVADYPSRWLVASSEGIDDLLDVRNSPTFYVLDSEGKIVAKNVSAERAAAIAIEGVKE
ncbi:MAG: DUF5106 domain-containing protein [Bacteroidales bacterium]|nr:DUF5106 domain-containing protein [Bacteroidales bacterium]MBD5218577.1 DUF5106 domain-containing protein [Bacteroidales bacterium]MBD5221236.1 DUF5106 domain-containing protein [Bacteroidales bacterium]